MSEGRIARSLLRKNPALLLRIAFARANVVLRPLPKRAVRRRMGGGVVFEFDFGDASLLDSFQYAQPAMKAMLFGSYEPLIRWTMGRFLKSGGVFLDVGANIGYLSAVGASLVGRTGQVHSFEPVPRYFRHVQKLAALNPSFHIHANQCALGEESSGVGVMTLVRGNIGGNSLVPGAHAQEQIADTVEVPLRRLDDYLAERGLEQVSLIKIDVEGFEFRVLRGMSHYFETTGKRPPMICEINPDAAGSLGYTMEEMADYMGRLGYRAYSLVDTRREIRLTDLQEYGNVLFLAEPPGGTDR